MEKGKQKKPVKSISLIADFGLENDAHGGNWHRQISLLADEDIETMRGKGIELGFGDFAENITTKGIDLAAIPIGSKLFMDEAVIEITQIGKKCHHGCEIFQKVGDCVMPRKGIFAKVIREGEISDESYCYYII